MTQDQNYPMNPGPVPPPEGAHLSAGADLPDEGDRSYARYRAEDRSIGEIVSDVMDNASTLIRQEVALARAELRQSATRAGTGVGLIVGAVVFALLALVALTLALWWWIAVALGSPSDPMLGWSGVIVMVLWAIVAAILFVAGRGSLKKMQGLPQTTETVQKIPNAAMGNEEKNR
ncbi:MAG: phage holin family protein [Brooklawnia sp.]|uniref:phage holin family protein n=1 Tax=Brooklawnia sp. TaxID=2699740 RepID=UPI003C790176